jgi:UDP-glucose 4-epimerase
VDVDEAQAHIQRAMQMGLVPLIAHTVFDAYLLGIPYRRMLTICFCCDCCCTVRKGMRLAPSSLWDIVHPLPGLIVQVNEGCVGCGSCQVVCPIGAISIHEGRACIAEWCKGCGRCALECAVGAIELKLADDAEALSRLLQHIQGQTEIGGNGHRSRFN